MKSLQLILLGVYFITSGAFSLDAKSAITAKEVTKQTIDLSNLTVLSNKEKEKEVKKGQKAIIYFWAAWCPDCKQKLTKDLKEWHEKKDIQVFTINKDSREKKAKDPAKEYFKLN